jgi:predicted nucleotidyltransferase
LEKLLFAMQTPEAETLLSISALRKRLQAVLPRLHQQYAVERLALHGSRLRGEAHPGSDLDILVSFRDDEAGQQVSLLDFLALKHELEDLLGVPVDLGEAEALRGPAADTIRREAEPV